jgi:hypothetical protein
MPLTSAPSRGDVRVIERRGGVRATLNRAALRSAPCSTTNDAKLAFLLSRHHRHAMKRALLFLGLIGALVGFGLACRVARVPHGPSALIFGATALAGTAVYRQATGGCWAACNTGWVCNTTSGRCEPEARERQQRVLRRTKDDAATAAPPEATALKAANAAIPGDAGAPANEGE